MEVAGHGASSTRGGQRSAIRSREEEPKKLSLSTHTIQEGLDIIFHCSLIVPVCHNLCTLGFVGTSLLLELNQHALLLYILIRGNVNLICTSRQQSAAYCGEIGDFGQSEMLGNEQINYRILNT